MALCFGSEQSASAALIEKQATIPNHSTPQYKTIKIQNPEEYARKHGIVPPSPTAKLISMTIVLNQEEMARQSLVAPEWFGTEWIVQNVQSGGTSVGVEKIYDSYFSANGTAQVSTNVPAQWSDGGTGCDAATVSSAVGFDVTASYPVQASQSVSVGPNQTVEVIGRPTFDNKYFDIYRNNPFSDPSYKGAGSASKPIEVNFTQSEGGGLLYDKKRSRCRLLYHIDHSFCYKIYHCCHI